MEYILFLDKEKGEVRKVKVTEFGEEAKLQSTIEKHPEVLSIPAVGAIVPLTTEYPVNTGSVDLLAFDEGGRIYLIETKLHKNYDKRRALAQLIDYASQIAMHDTFEDFKAKIYRKRGKTLEEIVKESFGENREEILTKLEISFDKEDYVLVLVMDEFDAPLKDTILFLNKHFDLSIMGVELRRYVLDAGGEVFVPTVIGVEISRKGDKPKTPKTPITKEEFEKRYSEAGLGEIAREIIRSFDAAEKKYDEVRIVPTPQYLTLRIRGDEITISMNADPKGDHSVWVNNPNLYERVGQIGRDLGLKTKIPAGKKFGKVIDFGGVDGIESIVKKLGDLIDELVKIGTMSQQ
ncbi:hypothetical protein DRP04_01020 [Archaeoglobales archaeon]|nr:MAG: hypothetical protein DRP04_01020 [Archaeoglobales archaeon]